MINSNKDKSQLFLVSKLITQFNNKFNRSVKINLNNNSGNFKVFISSLLVKLVKPLFLKHLFFYRFSNNYKSVLSNFSLNHYNNILFNKIRNKIKLVINSLRNIDKRVLYWKRNNFHMVPHFNPKRAVRGFVFYPLKDLFTLFYHIPFRMEYFEPFRLKIMTKTIDSILKFGSISNFKPFLFLVNKNSRSFSNKIYKIFFNQFKVNFFLPKINNMFKKSYDNNTKTVYTTKNKRYSWELFKKRFIKKDPLFGIKSFFFKLRRFYELMKPNALWKLSKFGKKKVYQLTYEEHMRLYEGRLDILLYRSSLLPDLLITKKFIKALKVCVNGKIIDMPRHVIKPFDTVTFDSVSRLKIKICFFTSIKDSIYRNSINLIRFSPSYLEFDYKIFGFSYIPILFDSYKIPFQFFNFKSRNIFMNWGKHYIINKHIDEF